MYYLKSFLSCIVEVPKALSLDLNSFLGCDLRCERLNYLLSFLRMVYNPLDPADFHAICGISP